MILLRYGDVIEPGTLLFTRTTCTENIYTFYFGRAKTQSLLRDTTTLIRFNQDDCIEVSTTWMNPDHISEMIHPITRLRLNIGKIPETYVIESYDDILDILPIWVVISCGETMSCINRIVRGQVMVSPCRDSDTVTLTYAGVVPVSDTMILVADPSVTHSSVGDTQVESTIMTTKLVKACGHTLTIVADDEKVE